MAYFGRFYLDREKDMIVEMDRKKGRLYYTLRTPNHHSGNLIRNLAKLCGLPLTTGKNDLLQIEGEIPSYIDAYGRTLWIFRLGGTKVANIFPDGSVEMKASIPAVSKTLMSQTKDYRLGIAETIIKTYILTDCKFTTDLHTHMNANLSPDVLIALGITKQIRYPYYYVKKLGLRLSENQKRRLEKQRKKVAKSYADSDLEGKYLERRIDDNTFINFADLILNNLRDASYNIPLIRASLSILKDGQAVFTNLEKVYLYRYVFTKGRTMYPLRSLSQIKKIPDEDIRNYAERMIIDAKSEEYKDLSLFQTKLLWIARYYQSMGIRYVEISDTTLVKPKESVRMLEEVHEVMPKIEKETGVTIRFLAAIRRIPLTIVRDTYYEEDYLRENLDVLSAVAIDPYVAGSDIVGEEVNDIRELKPLIKGITEIAKDVKGFVIRIHAGENDSLKDNVANSVSLVKESLAPGQKMPYVRLGHGLYTPSLRSARGQELLKELRDNRVVLEFQITSNVRLNNLTGTSAHPLKKYLKEDILCVQGSDGAAIYGSSSIDEQLSLEKLLNLSYEDMKKMKDVEDTVCKESMEVFRYKMKTFLKKKGDEDIASFYRERIGKTHKDLVFRKRRRRDSALTFAKRLSLLPDERMPVIIAGGSFNHDRRYTRLRRDVTDLLDILIERTDPKKAYFVIGNTLSGYERYLVDHDKGRHEIYAVVPALVSDRERKKIDETDVKVLISTELTAMSLYKSFNYEIFERRDSLLLALDGNSAGANLIQEAKNGKGKAHIFLYAHSPLKEKGLSLQGYVKIFEKKEEVTEEILKIVS